MKQKKVAMSTCKAEYIALKVDACQGIWLSILLYELTSQNERRFPIMVDNKSTIALSKNLVYHNRSKHIEIM